MLLRGLKMLAILLLSYCNWNFIKKLFTSPDKRKTQYLYDDRGRIAIYHGVNVCNYSKHAPGNLPWQTKEDFARLKDWGFNLVRYMVFWSAIEPVKGSYDVTYMQLTLERLKWLEELGIDVVLDMHQDLYCQKYGGNGFPIWTVNNDIPFIERTPWNLNYTEPAIIASYDYFWKSEDLKISYVKFLKHVLDNVDFLDNVIGIDVMNEPFQGTLYNFEKDYLSPFYETIQKMMLETGYKTRMFFEPTMLTSSGMPTNLTFKPGPKAAFFPHYYDIFCHEGKPYKAISKDILTKAIEVKIKEAQDFGVPILLGEFGAGPMIENYLQYLSDYVLLANEYLMGWTYYTYDKVSYSGYGILNDDGTERDQLKSLVCVYPQKIAGKNPVVVDIDEGLTLSYDTIPGETEIFIPKGLYRITVNGMLLPDTYSGTVFKYVNDDEKKQVIKVYKWSK